MMRARRGAAPAGGVLGVGLLAAAGCGEISRPVFPGSELDTLGPSIQILSPRPDTTITRPDVLVAVVVIRDASRVDTVSAAVFGAIAFAFPPYSPRDTILHIQFPVPTQDAAAGPARLEVEAVDGLRNRAITTLPFVVK